MKNKLIKCIFTLMKCFKYFKMVKVILVNDYKEYIE